MRFNQPDQHFVNQMSRSSGQRGNRATLQSLAQNNMALASTFEFVGQKPGGTHMGFKFASKMLRMGTRRWIALTVALSFAGVVSASIIPNLFPFLDPTGLIATFNLNGPINTGPHNPFFENLGTNGRNCGTCHIAANAMGLSLQNVQERFVLTHGRDPLFADFDGANCPNNPRPGDPAAHSLLLKAGLIRIPIALAAAPQFQIRAIHDPYGCAITTDPTTGAKTVSVYRRPLPTTNLRFLSAIMFDGRESSTRPLNNSATFMDNLIANLKQQAVDATLGHAQGANLPTDEQQTAIVNFELGLFSSQVLDARAGLLSEHGAQGDPVHLSKENYYPGINDSLGADPSGNKFNPDAMTLFDDWNNASGFAYQLQAARRDIAAGQAIFNSRPVTITNVRGLNDNAALGNPTVIMGNCTTCHDTPNVGNHSLPLPLDISTGHDPKNETDLLIASGLDQLSMPDLPVFEITGCPNPFATPGSPAQTITIYTTDPGKGLLTGLCSDVNRIKGPILRGLASRAPFFHNGAAHDLKELVNFYNQRFQMNLTDKEKTQLIAFLNSL